MVHTEDLSAVMPSFLDRQWSLVSDYERQLQQDVNVTAATLDGHHNAHRICKILFGWFRQAAHCKACDDDDTLTDKKVALEQLKRNLTDMESAYNAKDRTQLRAHLKTVLDYFARARAGTKYALVIEAIKDQEIEYRRILDGPLVA